MKQEDVIKRFKEVHGDRYDYSLVEYLGTHKKVIIICSTHGEFEQAPSHHKRGSICPKCRHDESRKTLSDIVSDFENKHGDRYDYSLVEYINDFTKVEIVCNEHGGFYQKPNNHKNGQGCPECVKTDINNFIERAKTLHGNRYDYSKTEYENITTKVKIICSEHGIFEQVPHNHLNGNGCLECARDNRNIDTDTFINNSNLVHKNKYDYSKTEYTLSRNKVLITCLKHGDFYQKSNNHLNGKGCPRCKESKGESLISAYLINKNIHFEKEKTFNGCVIKGKLKFDFYLPDDNICIEYDGIQHFEAIDFFGGEEGLLERKKSDSIKSKFLKDNDIKLIRIKYIDKNKIDEILDEFFCEE